MPPRPARRRARRLAGRALLFLLFPLLTSLAFHLPWGPLTAARRALAGVRLTDREGRLLYSLPAEGGAFSLRLGAGELPAEVQRIFVRLEDRRFYRHRGVDPLAAARAAAAGLGRGRVVSGASTITMQAARLVAPHCGGWAGKAREVLGALRLEAALDKEQILLLYLNLLPFGRNTIGVGAAAVACFDRPLQELTPAQVLLLATLPRAPARYDPFRHPQALRAEALSLAPQVGIPGEEVDRALRSLRPGQPVLRTPHFVLYVLDELPRLAALHSGGRQLVRVTTALDLGLYERVSESLRQELARTVPAVPDAAVLLLDNASGEVLAYVGSPDFRAEGGQVDAVRARSPSGSTLKPFLYALALERGWSCADLLPDLPLSFGGEEQYCPENFDRRSRGVVRLRAALAGSLNVPAVYLLSRLGLQPFLSTCAALGLEPGPAGRLGLGAAIGNASVRLEELARAFSVFPRGGSLPPRVLVREMWTAEGRCLPVPAGAARRVFSPETAWLVSSVLSDPSARATGFGTRSRLNTPFPAMFKSGTSSGCHSLWCLGATPVHTVGVWAGSLQRRSAFGVTGSSLPAAVARRILEELAEGPEEVNRGVLGSPPPAGLEPRRICALTGCEASPACPAVRLEYFRRGSPPGRPCPVHAGGASLEELALERFLEGAAGPRILFPRPGTIFYSETSLPPGSQWIRAWVAARPGMPVQVLLNGRPVPWTGTGEPALPVAPGRYCLEAVGAAGRDAVSYEVR